MLLYISAVISFACAVACIILGTGVLAVVLWMLCGALSLTGGTLATRRYNREYGEKRK